MSLSPVLFTSSSLIPSTDASPLSSSKARGKRIKVEKTDLISELVDEILLIIVSKLGAEDAIKTSVLSRRWKNIWKEVPSLVLDVKRAVTFMEKSLQPDIIAEMITQVIENHNGDLRCCRIPHFPDQCEDGNLETWIQSLTQVKHTKCIVLVNIRDKLRRGAPATVLQLSPQIFSHPSLSSLCLSGYGLESAQAFNNSHNLKILKLENTRAEIGEFNTVIASCPSLQVLLLDIAWYSNTGCLKIHHNKLKMLHLVCSRIDRIEVTTPLLDFLAIHCDLVTSSHIHLEAPRLRIQKSFPILAETIYYNISSDVQEIIYKKFLPEFMMNIVKDLDLTINTLVVNVDLTNPREVDMLKEVCDLWGRELGYLFIFFKHNKVQEKESESSIGQAQKPKFKDGNFFISADFRVGVVWMFNLSDFSEEEYALASLLVTQRTVTDMLVIQTSSIPANKKLKVEADVAKLMRLPKGNENLTIQFF